MRFATALVAALAVALPALAQERDPAQRQTLNDLAYVLGEAHGLRQLCDPRDQNWRLRMLSMVDTEGAEHDFAERLRGAFNTGYVASQSRYTACSAESRKAESGVAVRGQGLAARMAAIRIPAPDSVAPVPPPG